MRAAGRFDVGGYVRIAAMTSALSIYAVLLAGCSSEPAEQRLRSRIDTMQTAIAERRIADFMEGVAEDFIGNDNINRAALHNLMRVQALRNASIGATRGPMTVELQGDRATVSFDVVLTGGSGGLIPERAEGYGIKSGWRDEDGEWRVYFAQWGPALGRGASLEGSAAGVSDPLRRRTGAGGGVDQTAVTQLGKL